MQMNTSHFFINKCFGFWSCTIRRAISNHARKIISVIVTISFSMQMIACGSAPKQSEMNASCGESTPYMWANDKDTSSNITAMFEYQKSPSLRCVLVAPAKRYGVQAYVEWSNGWIEYVTITDDLKMEPGQRYIVLAYEKDRGPASVTDVKLWGYTSNAAKALMYPVAMPIVAVQLLYAWPALLLEDKRDGPQRPSEDCYVWIENSSTGEVLAGTDPSVGIKQSLGQELHE